MVTPARKGDLLTSRLAIVPLLGLGLAAGGGCVVHTYQPLSGLHRPVVVDPTAPNLADVHLTVRCLTGPYVHTSDANVLCRKVALLFENQGALVTTSLGGPPDEEEDRSEGPAEPRPIDLVVELRARKIHEASPPLGWVAMVASFSLAPAITEFTFEQELRVRDANGFLLSEDRLRGRIVYWYGFGTWASNKLLDATVRESADEVVGDHANRALSDDLYAQLSQSVFDARMQARVLDRTATPGAGR